MPAKRRLILMAALVGCGLIVGLWSASGQQAPPTENKGVKSDVLATIDLGLKLMGCKVANSGCGWSQRNLVG